MIGSVATMSVSAAASRRAPTIYRAAGLLDDPFPRGPEAGAYVEIPTQRAALSEIRAWLASLAEEDLGLAVIAGAHGSGKTRLLGQLVLSLADDDRLIGVIPANGARRSDAQLLRSAIAAVGGTPSGRTGLELINELRAILDAHRDDPMRPVLLIDNAALTGSQLEIMRGILTAGTPDAGQARVQIVLFGPPELPDRIARRRSLAGLTRRIMRLPPLDIDATATLLHERVASVRDSGTEWPERLFTGDAVRIIHEAAQGNPGAVLALAHAAVRETIATGRQLADTVVARAVTAASITGPGSSARAQDATAGDQAIQTRLSLPGMEEDTHASAPPRRRERQR